VQGARIGARVAHYRARHYFQSAHRFHDDWGVFTRRAEG
jgi:hypothetical protein